ncbi:ABC transporter permease [Methylobacterium oryzisoli]|uniref:ABC transporter permease n=1 Tax=Methylobacterium oryzisoli TaxID=3385502 RepID=UPI0038923C34
MSTGTPVTESAGIAAPVGESGSVREPGSLAAFWRRLRARPSAVIGLAIVVAFIAMAALADVVAPYDPTATDWGAVRAAPSLAHPFGGDEVGRDVLSRIIYGARASLGAGLVSVGLAVALGLPIGLVSGYAGGWVDAAIMRLTDALLAIPFLILAIALAAFLGPSLTNAMLAIGLSATSTFVRLTRAQVRAVAAEEFVEAARSVGNPPWRIALVHILPNIVPAILVQATLTIAAAIIAEASLSFLGLGQQPPEPSWGAMLNVAKNFMEQAPWMAIWPGVSIFLAVLAFNLLGDGLRDALDPRQRT